MGWFNRKQQQQREIEIHTQTFTGKHFDYCYDEFEDKYIVTSYYKQYVMNEKAARDLEAWADDEKKKYENSLRLKREFGIDMPQGTQYPKIADWYKSLTDTKLRDENILLIDLEGLPQSEPKLSQIELEIRKTNWQRYVPEIQITSKEISYDNYEAFVVDYENGVRYYGLEASLKSSLTTYYSNAMQYNPEHIPTLKEWFNSAGGQFRKEEIKKQSA